MQSESSVNVERSFEEKRTSSSAGVAINVFLEAASLLGLISDSDELILCTSLTASLFRPSEAISDCVPKLLQSPLLDLISDSDELILCTSLNLSLFRPSEEVLTIF